jgi:hypothetical protein
MVDGSVRREVRIFKTTTTELLGLSDWLAAEGCTHVAMEATGVYWKPVWHILSDRDFSLVLANALASAISDVMGLSGRAMIEALIVGESDPERRLPALSSLRGHRPAQEIRWPAVGKRLMSRPISARMRQALNASMPGMVVRRWTVARKGSI